MKLKDVKLTTRTVEERGIELPWKRIERYGPIREADGRVVFADHPPKGTVLDSGTVFVKLDLLYEIADQDPWAGAFGSSFIVGNSHVKLALVGAGLAVEETRGGVHGTDKLKKLLKRLEASK